MKLRIALPLALAGLLGLACNGLGALPTEVPLPGPETVVAAATQTAAAPTAPGATATLDPDVATAVAGTPTATRAGGQGPEVASATPKPSATPAPSNTAPTPTQPAATATSPAPGDSATPAGPPIGRLPGGQALTLQRIDMLDAGNGWAVGTSAADPHDHVLWTTDGGATWREITPPETAGTAAGGRTAVAFFLDANRGWVAYADREFGPVTEVADRVWRTQDGGQSWSAGQPLNLGEVEHYAPSDLVFAGPQTGWLLAHVGAGMNHDYVVLFLTRDGGQTWERIADPYGTSFPQSCTKTGLGFLTPTTGWLTGDCYGVAPGVFFYSTADAGRTWQPVSLPAPAEAPDFFTRETGSCGTYGLHTFAPAEVLVVVACQDFQSGEAGFWLYRSTDGALTWTSAPAPGRTLDALAGGLGWAQAEVDPNTPQAARVIAQTDDGGQSWAGVSQVTWAGQFDFIDATHGWAVARAGDEVALVRTVSGGQRWTLVQPLVAP